MGCMTDARAPQAREAFTNRFAGQAEAAKGPAAADQQASCWHSCHEHVSAAKDSCKAARKLTSRSSDGAQQQLRGLTGKLMQAASSRQEPQAPAQEAREPSSGQAGPSTAAEQGTPGSSQGTTQQGT